MNILELLELLAILPGDIAKRYRKLAAKTIVRDLAGDNTLINIINKNRRN